MKKIIIPALLLTVAAVSIHCEAESPLTVNAATDSTFIVIDSVVTDTIVVDTVVTDTIISDTIYHPHDSIPVIEPGNPGVPDTTHIDSVYVPRDSVTGLRLRSRR
nr:hypothetical protein [uncultured Flavobacterium sp.]